MMLTLAGCTEKKAADTGAAVDTAMITTPAPAPAAAATPAPPPADLRSRSDAFVSAWNRKSVPAIAAFFAADAVVHDPDSTYTGRAEITRRWLAPGVPLLADLRISEQTFIGTGDTLTENGSYSEVITQPKKAPTQHTGTYTIVWTKVGADWIVKQMTTR
jgi:ketosteroid isomerase-like protein